MLRLTTLGGLAVENQAGGVGGAAGQRKHLALLALLAPTGGRGLSRDKILAYLWPEIGAEKAAHSLSQALYALRRDLRTDAVFLGSTDLRFNQQAISVDLAEFLGALDRGEPERAVSVYAGPFLDGFYLNAAPEFEHWVEIERADYARRFEVALESLASQAARRGDFAGAVEWWRRRAEGDPFNTRIAVEYMQALDAVGDRVTALRVAREHEALLRDELGATPDPVVAATVERIRRHPATAVAAAEENDGARDTESLRSIAVLPFVNLSPDRENEYFSDGMTDELTSALGLVPGLRVVARSSAFTFKGKDADAREIGRSLGVTALVEGSVRKIGKRVRITAQLIRVADGQSLWTGTYERTMADVFGVQEALARAIVSTLPLGGLQAKGTRLVRTYTEDLEAYTLYLRGRYFANRRNSEGLRIGVEYFEQAIEHDPSYALAYAGLAECYALLGFEEFGDMAALEAMPKAKAAAQRALEIEPDLAEAHGAMGVILTLYDWDWAAAERAFVRAVRLKPAAAPAVYWYPVFLSAMGRHEEGLQLIERAVANDPLSLVVHMIAGRCYCFAERYDVALQHFRTCLEMEPGRALPYGWVARVHCERRMFQEALQLLEAGLERCGRDAYLLMMIGFAYGAAGMRPEALRILDELREQARSRYIPPKYEAMVFAGLGDADEFFRYCELAYRQRSGYMAFARVQPPLVSAVRRDPRHQALLERLRLDR